MHNVPSEESNLELGLDLDSLLACKKVFMYISTMMSFTTTIGWKCEQLNRVVYINYPFI